MITMWESIPPRFATLMASLYTTQYVGVAFIMAAAIAILRKNGVSLDQLALLNLVALPLALKIFLAPFIDRYRLFFRGHYRSWLLVAQWGMTATLLFIGTLDFKTQLTLIVVILTIYVFFVSFQDVAIDGLACKVFNHEQRQYANSLQFACNLLGNVIGGGLVLMAYPLLGWQAALWVLAGLTGISWIQVLHYSEPTAILSKETYNPNTLLGECKSFIGNNRCWFLLLFIYPLATSGAFAMVNPQLVDAGWTLGAIGFVTKVYGSIIGVLSALCAAFFLQKWGRALTLKRLTAVLGITLCFFFPIALGYATIFWVYLAITAYFSVFSALLVVFGTIMMDKASKGKRRATLFTLQFSLFSLMGFVYAGICMASATIIGYEWVVVVSILAIVACYYMVKRLKLF